MAWETLIYKKEGTLALVSLNRPQALNAFNTTMRDELFQVLEAARDDPEVRAIVLRGAGKRAFCAGADLTQFGTTPSQAEARRVRWERDLWGLFLSLRKPIVVALHGYVLGAGLEMALLGDLRIAAQDAILGLPETALSMAPAAGGSQMLPRTVGVGVALELLLTGRRISALEALQTGLVSEVVPRARLGRRVRAVAHRLASLDPRAVTALKEAVHRGMDLHLAQGLELEVHLATALAQRRSHEQPPL